MSKKPKGLNLDDYRPTNYRVLVRRLSEGKRAYISGDELAAALRANRGKRIPDPLFDYLCRFLEGEARRPAGRKSGGDYRVILEGFAVASYERYFHWLSRRNKTLGLKGWSCIREAEWWQGPPGERAARMVRARWFRTASYRHVQNVISRNRSSK